MDHHGLVVTAFQRHNEERSNDVIHLTTRYSLNFYRATKGLHLAAVKKNNMKDKNKDLDRYYTKTRDPFENVFSQDNKRAMYKGIAKNQFAAFMQAICFNLKRLQVIISPPKNLAL